MEASYLKLFQNDTQMKIKYWKSSKNKILGLGFSIFTGCLEYNLDRQNTLSLKQKKFEYIPLFLV
jgi:hypothetical protein